MGGKSRNFRVGAFKQGWEMEEIRGQEDQRKGNQLSFYRINLRGHC